MRCPDENTLTEFVAGLLDPAQVPELETHLDRCPSCHRLLVEVALTTAPEGEDAGPEPLPAGPLAGRYQLQRVLGAGGMSLVYVARDTELDRLVAVKVMLDAPGDVVGQLRAEGHALARLRHPNVAQIYDVGIGDAHAYIVMELIEGDTLRLWWPQAERTWRDGIEMMRQVARGLSAAHEAGLVHRDVSPSNVVVAHDGRARLVDFGLAIELEGPASETVSVPGSPGAESIPQPAGTPGYVAPEVLLGAPVTPAADQYGLCATFAEVLGPSSDLPRRVRAVFQRGMQTDPGRRFPSVADLEAALGRAMRGAGGGAGRWVLAVGAVGAISAAVFFTRTPATHRTEPPGYCDSSSSPMSMTWTADAQARLGALADEQGANPVVEQLSRYVDQWRALHDETCSSADLAAREVELRGACLEARHRTFDALVDHLVRSSPIDVAVARGAIEALPPIADCRDPDARRVGSTGLTPDELVQHQALQRTIDEIKTASDLGALDEARARIDEAITRAEALDATWLLAAALVERGRLERESGDMETAARTLETAAHLAATEGDERLSARAWIMHMAIRGLYVSDLEEVERLRRAVEASLARLSRLPPSLTGFHQYTLGTIYDQVGASELAQVAFQRAVDAYSAAPGPHPEAMDNVLEALAVSHARSGDRPQAREAFERILELRRASLGGRHPRVGRVLGNLAALDSIEGRFGSAVEHAQLAYQILEPRLGPEHPTVFTLHATLGQALLYDDRPAAALEHLRKSAAGREQALGASHPGTMSVRLDLAACLETLERIPEAAAELAAAERALDGPAVSPMLRGTVLLRVGRLALRQGSAERALQSCRAAVEATEAEGLEPMLGSARLCVGLSRAEFGEPQRALAAFEAALSDRYLELSLVRVRQEVAAEVLAAVPGPRAERVAARLTAGTER